MRKTLLLLFMLAACGREDRVAEPTAEESRRLDEAEAMLNEAANGSDLPAAKDR